MDGLARLSEEDRRARLFVSGFVVGVVIGVAVGWWVVQMMN